MVLLFSAKTFECLVGIYYTQNLYAKIFLLCFFINMKINSIKHTNFRINFKSYNMIDNDTGNSLSTNFYHDSEVLQKSVKIIEKEFPDGTDILVYAGSNGEEALSLNTLLNNRQKYKIYSIDKSSKAIDFAHNGIYAIHPLAEDGFLVNHNSENNKQLLRQIFYKNFIETSKPANPVNNIYDPIYTIRFDNIELYPQRFFIPKKSCKENISFIKGDIRDIEQLNKYNKAGAIFFRNAIYQLTDNDLNGVFKFGDKPNFETDKRKVINELIEKIYNKLETNGIFVLGNHLQEHLYIADKTIPLEDTVLVDKIRNIRFMKNHPIIEALNKNGKFKPLFEFLIPGLGNNTLQIPLIWQKIK